MVIGITPSLRVEEKISYFILADLLNIYLSRSYYVSGVMKIPPSHFKAYFWLIICAAVGVAMAFLFVDSRELDGGYHYLFARLAWRRPELFVGVWSRPLFTLLYAFPAMAGHQTTKLFSVLVCLVIAHQTWRLATDLKIERAPLAIAFLWLQPMFFLYCADTMTEPVFALVYVLALRLHHLGRVK